LRETTKKGLLVGLAVIPLSFPLGYLLGGVSLGVVMVATAIVIVGFTLAVVSRTVVPRRMAPRGLFTATFVGVVSGLLGALGMLLAHKTENLVPLFVGLGLFAVGGAVAAYVTRGR